MKYNIKHKKMNSYLHEALGVDKHIKDLHGVRRRGEISKGGNDYRLAHLWGQNGTKKGVKKGRLHGLQR
jgi:hypothetical protein